MASRKTLEAAKECQERLQKSHTSARIIIVECATDFAILEAKECRDCGAEFTTRAIGEFGNSLCKNCKTDRAAKREQKAQRAATLEIAETNRYIAWNEMQE